ncbi:hypothetical protein BGX33_004481 [Mortierella sp. NVP41]|nr:hypothetical protein BGX33_004481 [Mortierella sp. NVP41]
MVLGVSTNDMSLDAIESIVITINQDIRGFSHSKSEVITHKELKRVARIESAAQTDVNHLWKLNEKVFLSRRPLEIVIEIITWDDHSHTGDGTTSLLDYGSLGLQFMEFHTDSGEYYKEDSMYVEHQPFIHSVDINRTGCQELDSFIVDHPGTITSYTVSGQGSHVLVGTIAGEQRFLQLWKFQEPPIQSRRSSQESSHSTKSNDTYQPPFTPQLVAWMQLPVTKEWSFDLSLSWDGSQVVVIDMYPFGLPDDEKEDYRSATAFYECDVNYKNVPERVVARSGLRRYRVEETQPALTGYCGRGQFHIVATKDQDIRDELFVTCDGVTVEIYSVYGEWSHLRSILLSPARNGPEFATDVRNAFSKQLRGRFLIMEDSGTSRVCTWEIEQGIRVSSFSDLSADQILAVSNFSTMSKEGKLIAIPGRQHIDVYWTMTWTLVGTYAFMDMESTECIGDTQFIRNDSQVMVGVGSGEQPFYRRNRGYILDIETMTVVERFISQGTDIFWTAIDDSTSAEVFCFGNSQVSLFKPEDRVIQSSSKPRERCDGSCTSIASFKNHGKKGTTSSSGLYFNAEYRTTPIITNGRREKLSVVTVTVSDKNGLSFQRMSIPLPKAMVFLSATFVGNGCSHLVVALDKLAMIWSTTTSPHGGFTLCLVQTVDCDMSWNVCLHGQLYGLDTQDNRVIDERCLDDPTRHLDHSFLDGILVLVEIFEHAGGVLRQGILQYVGKYINRYVGNRGTLTGNVVPYICNNWSPEVHESTLLFLKALLLEDPLVRWVPRHMMEAGKKDGGNPIWCMLEKAKTTADPKAIEVVQVLVKYCIRQAKLDKDPHFLLPVKQCLGFLTNSDVKGWTAVENVVLELYRGLVFIPARPVRLSSDASEQEQEQDLGDTRAALGPRRDKFSRELYYASVDMLWYRIDSGKSGSIVVVKEGNSSRVLTWLRAMWSLFVYKLKLKKKDTVKCYLLNPQVYDNPALEALVDCRWNTIGLSYWRNQFIARCCYYLIVLAAVMLQIYGKSKIGAEGYVVYFWAGMFFDILTTAFIFLCVEVVQIFRQGFSYFRSIFNIADFLVLVLPFAGSVNQLCILTGISKPPGQNSGFLSFSVLIVLLHFTFELRVFKSAARVVSHIVRAIESLAPFLVVYVIGALGFLTAFIHMIPACLDAASCSSLVDSLDVSSDFITTISGTQLSGRSAMGRFYSDSWANFALAFAFFLFNVIILLNMIIVLIQETSAPDAQDKWKQEWFKHRLHFVESAENSSYRNSGVRKKFKKFPDVVYYSATSKEICDYEKETERLRLETTSVELPGEIQRRWKAVGIREATENLNKRR